MNTPASLTANSLTRGHPRLLFVTFMLGFMAQALAFTAFVSVLPQLARDFGPRGALIAQLTFGVAALGMLIGALASGWILERAGTQRTLLISSLLYGLAGSGGLVLRDPMLLLVTRFIVGFSSACMVTTCVWGIGAEYVAQQRARALGFAAALANVMGVTGTLLGGYLAERAGWPLAFVQYPVLGVFCCALTLVSLRQMKPALDGATMHVALFARLLPFYGLATLLYVVLFMGSTQFAFLLDQNGLVNASTRSLVMCMSTVSGAFASAGYGVVQKRHGALGAFVLGLFAMALALGIAGGTNSVAMAVLAATLVGIYVGLITPYTYHFITEQTDDNSRARAVGFLVAFTFLGAFLNPFLIAPLSALMGLRHVFLCASLFMLVIAAGAVFRSRRNALYALRKEISA